MNTTPRVVVAGAAIDMSHLHDWTDDAFPDGSVSIAHGGTETLVMLVVLVILTALAPSTRIRVLDVLLLLL